MSFHHEIDWARLKARASFDAIDLHLRLDTRPRLDGIGSRHDWNLAADGRAIVTVQDPSPEDISTLAQRFPSALPYRLELPIDLWPYASVQGAERQQILDRTLQGVASHFDPLPSFDPRYKANMRGFLDAQGHGPMPFDRRVPPPEAQLLYGHRDDAMQVTCYTKRTDNKKRLPTGQQRHRTELRMHRLALQDHGIEVISDLIGLDYRATFARYFRFTRGVKPKAALLAKAPIVQQMGLWRLHDAWSSDRVGGLRAADPALVRRLRDSKANRRHGDALDGVTERMSREKFTGLNCRRAA